MRPQSFINQTKPLINSPYRRGKVYITVAATNSPAQRDAIRPAAVKRSLQPIRHANRRAQAASVVRDFTSSPTKRSPLSIGDAFDKVKNGVGNAVDAVKDGVGSAVDTVIDGAGEAVDAVENGANQVVDTVKDGFNQAVDATGDVFDQVGEEIGTIVDSTTGAVLDFVDSVRAHQLLLSIDTDLVLEVAGGTNFDKTFNKEFDVANINQQSNIFDESISCPQQGNVPAFEAGLKVDVGVAAKLTANVGFIVTGTIVPPEIEKLVCWPICTIYFYFLTTAHIGFHWWSHRRRFRYLQRWCQRQGHLPDSRPHSVRNRPSWT